MTGKRRGVPLVISAPSGAGKTTLCRLLMQRLEGLAFSVSHTTRAPRGAERDGIDYHFVDDGTFDRLVAEGAFLEWAHVHGRRYGTALSEVERQLDEGVDVLLDIDVQGGQQVRRGMADAVLVFVLPPSRETLEARLRGRDTDGETQVTRRLQAAAREAEAARTYTYWLVNDVLETAVGDLETIVKAERLRRIDRLACERALAAAAVG